MSRHEHFDDPHNYFRRLESYSPSRASSPRRGSQYNIRVPSPARHRRSESVGAGVNSHLSSEDTFKSWRYDDFQPQPQPNSRPQSYIDSSPRSHVDSRSYLDSRPHPHYNSRPQSYASSARPRSYADTEPLRVADPEKAALRRDHTRLDDQDGTPATSRFKWTRKRKWCLSIWIFLLIFITILAGVIAHVRATAFHYTPSNAHVTNATAFTLGGATRRNPNDTTDGLSNPHSGIDSYTWYTGGPSQFPHASSWISFEEMWSINLASIQTSCSVLGAGSDNSATQTQEIYTAIQNRAAVSLVDHRLILAIILQESHGCVHIGSTTSKSGVRNPGLMQSHDGSSFSSSHSSMSILAMVQDGTQGTSSGDGLVQNLNMYGDPYSAARGYNSGTIAKDGDLSDGVGATGCYVSDVANRLTGWVRAKSTCLEYGSQGGG